MSNKNKKNSAFSLIELSIVILIIGILVAGITQSSRLVAAMKLASARSLTQGAPVTSIKDVVAWFDATRENAFATGTTSYTDVADPEDGEAIGRWNDGNLQLSHKSNATQTTAANQPTYLSQGINDLPVVSLDGSTSYFAANDLKDLHSGDHTVFIVLNGESDSGASVSYDVLSWNDNANSASNFISLHHTTGLLSYDGSGNTTTNILDLNTIISSTADLGGDVKIYVNGTSETSGSYSPASNITRFSIGQEWDDSTASNFFKGQIGEIIFFDRVLKTQERKDIEQYLGKKWGIAVAN